jgi:3',5'-cyclic AMP phosphodiesterase CpdA
MPSSRRTTRVVVSVGLILTLATGMAIRLYGPQIMSFASHVAGSTTNTKPLAPFPPEAKPDLRVAVAGDVGYANDREKRTATAMAQAGEGDPYDVLLLLGDNVYPSGEPSRLPETVFGPFQAVLDAGAKLLAILGNHDIRDEHANAQVAALGMPGRWYAERVGDVTFIALDSNDPMNPDQRAWLEQALAATRTTWKVVALHHPPYSAGYQGSSIDARQQFSPLFERYGVQLVLSGHEHDYQRSVPINGVTYVVSGGAADTRRTGREEFTAKAVSWHHFVDLNVFADHMLLRAVNQSGRVFDEIRISQSGAGLTAPGE